MTGTTRFIYHGVRGIVRRVWYKSRVPVTKFAKLGLVIGGLCIAILCIHSFMQSSRLFVPYTTHETTIHARHDISSAAAAYMHDHPHDMCISSLELSHTNDLPYFHIILRSNMHKSYEGKFHELLNPEYVLDAENPSKSDSSLASSTHHHHTHTTPRASSLLHYGNDENQKESIAAFRPTTPPNQPSSDADLSMLGLALKKAGRIPQLNDGPSDVNVLSEKKKAVRYSSHLQPPSNVELSSEWKLNREENSFCEYVYHQRGGIISRLLKFIWPAFSFHPQDVTIQQVYRKKKINVRYRDLVTFMWVERTFVHEHAYCIQHYMDIWNNAWEC